MTKMQGQNQQVQIMDYGEIRTAVVSGLNSFMELLVVELNPDAPRPGKPFLSYLFITPLGPEGGLPAETGGPVPSEDEDSEWEYDFEYTRTSQDTVTISINSYSDDSDEAIQLAIKAHSWFVFHGYDYLKSNNLVIVSVGTVENRDVYLVDSWERRAGFDVVLRVITEMRRVIETIEKVEMEFKEVK